jgi:hypothetical protein
MRTMIFIATSCVLLSACGAYHPIRTQEASHSRPASPGDEVKGRTVVSNTVVHRGLTNARSGATASKLTPKRQGKTVRSNTVVHRGLTNARSGATASKRTPKGQGKTVQRAPAAQETFRGAPVSPGDQAGPTGSKLTPIQAAQEAFRGAPVSPGDEAGAIGSKLTAIQAAQEAFRSAPVFQER